MMQNNRGLIGLAGVASLKDSELMLKIAESDASAFEHLYDRYSSVLYSLIYKMVGSKEFAEKILADVFFILWNRIDEFDTRTANAFTWLVTLTRNKTLDEIKRLNSDNELPDYDENFEREFILPSLSSEINPIELSQVIKLKEKIALTINELTEAQKYVLMLLYFGGFSEIEIAEKLKIPTPTVRSKLQVGLQTLSEKLNINGI